MLTVMLVLVLVGLLLLAASVAGKVPLWSAVFVLYMLELLRVLPVR